LYIVSAQENVGLKADRLKKSLGLQNKGKLEIEQVKVKERLTRSDNMTILYHVEASQVRNCDNFISRRSLPVQANVLSILFKESYLVRLIFCK
jgi:hypothetical protein